MILLLARGESGWNKKVYKKKMFKNPLNSFVIYLFLSLFVPLFLYLVDTMDPPSDQVSHQ